VLVTTIIKEIFVVDMNNLHNDCQRFVISKIKSYLVTP